MEAVVTAPPVAASPAPTSAPVAIPVASPAAAETPQISEGQSVRDYLNEGLKEATSAVDAADKAEDAAEKTGTVAEVVPAKEEVPTVAEPGKEAAAAPTEEEVAAKAIADAAKAEEEKNKPAATELDMGETVAPSKLAEKFNAAPKEVQEWLNNPDNAEFKNGLFAMARRDDLARPILRKIPNVQTADALIETHGKFHDFDSTFASVDSSDTARGAWSKLWQDFATKGADGKLQAHPAFLHMERTITQANVDAVLHAAEQTGRIHPLLGGILSKTLDVIEKQAKVADNVELLDAIGALREANPASSQPTEELTPAQKQRAADLDAREEAITRQDRTAREAKVKESTERADYQSVQSAVEQFLPVIKRANLSPFEHGEAIKLVGSRLKAELNQNHYFTQREKELKAAIAANPSEAAEKALTDHIIAFQQPILGEIVTKVIREVTAGRITRQTAKDEKVAAQIEKSKSDPAGVSTAVAGAPSVMTAAQEREADQKEWDRINPGRAMPEAFHLDRSMKRDMQRP